MLPETPYTFTDFGNQSTIWNNYAPFLSIPIPEIRTIDPAWSSCYFYPQFDALFDPPHALASATIPLTPTSAAVLPDPAPPPAQPASNGISEMPSRTATQLDAATNPVDPRPPPSQVSIDPQPATSLPAATPQSPAPQEPSKSHISATPVSPDPHLNGQSEADPQLAPSTTAARPQLSAPQQPNNPYHSASAASSEPLVNVQSGIQGPSQQAIASNLNSPQVESAPSHGAGQSRRPEGNPSIQGSFNPSVAATPQSIAWSGAVITIGSQVLTVVASRPVVIDGATLSIHGPAATMFKETISLGLSAVAVGDSVVPYSSLLPAAAGAPTLVLTRPATPHAIFTLGSQTLTAVRDSPSSGVVMIGSATLVIGGPPATINGQTVSAEPSGVILDGVSTITFSEPTVAPSTVEGIGGLISGSSAPTAGASTPVPTKAPSKTAVLTLGTHTLTAMYVSQSSNLIVVGTATLSVGGPAATMNGQTMSAERSAIVVNGVSTITLSDSSSATSTAGGIGGMIISMLGPWESPSGTGAVGNSTMTPSHSIELFSSAAPRRELYEAVTLLVIALIIALL